MNLKRAIQIISYSNAVLILGLLAGVIAVITNYGKSQFLFFEMLFILPLVLAFFFRKLLVSFYMKRTAYPGVFYSVVDKLGLARNLGIDLTDDLLNEIYKPAYSTHEFLSDNQLKTEIGTKKLHLPSIFLSIGLGLAGLWYLGQKYKFQDRPAIFLVLAAIVAMNMIFWVKSRARQNDNEPIAFFKEDVLELPNGSLRWKDIYDWDYQPGARNQPSRIMIRYYDDDKNARETSADLSRLNIHKIDFLLLMAHFKGKYGNAG